VNWDINLGLKHTPIKCTRNQEIESQHFQMNSYFGNWTHVDVLNLWDKGVNNDIVWIGTFYTIGKILKHKYQKRAHIFYLEIWISNYGHKSDCIENQFSNLTPNHSQETWIKWSMIRTSHMALKYSHQRLETLRLMTSQLEFKYGNYEPTKLRDS